MTPFSSVKVGLGILSLYLLKRIFFDNRTARTPLPPGPKGLPVLGNIKDLPAPGRPEFEHWLEHKARYGPISSINVLGLTMIIVHDKSMVMELMEKRGSKHSGRARMKFAMDMIGWINTIISQQYDKTFRRYRKYANQQLGTKASIQKYSRLLETAVGRFLWRLNHSKGEDLLHHLKTEAGEIIIKIMYNYTIEPHSNDPLVDLTDRTMVQFSAATVPGAWLVDMIPVLEYLPEWMPGAGFKKTARLWRQSLLETATIPYEFVKRQMAAGKNDSSFVSKSIEQAISEGDLGPDEEHAIKWAAVSLYLGGADTSVQTVHAFFLAMSMFPDVQRKAQAEIDRVVGSSRLPSSADRDKLPYINCIVNEAQRWHPITPMGFPHVSDEEDHIAGYRIPKGALLLPAIWWFTRDPEVYHDPEMFKPERYSEPYNEPPPTDVTFGFGRRICPGRYLADASLYLTFAQSLAVFNIEKALGEDGQVIEPKHGFKPGIISPVAPFQMVVTPRTGQHEQLVEDVLKRFPWEESDKDKLGQIL